MLGGVNMREAQIYIKNIKKTKKLGVWCLNWSLPPQVGCSNITSYGAFWQPIKCQVWIVQDNTGPDPREPTQLVDMV